MVEYSCAGFHVELARFKEKWVWCDGCRQTRLRHEEKETDVALAVKLIELFCERKCDSAIIMTGDTDIAPAVRFVQHYYPTKRVAFLFPYGRKNKELAKQALSRKITKEQYLKYQFPSTVTLADGSLRPKPTSW